MGRSTARIRLDRAPPCHHFRAGANQLPVAEIEKAMYGDGLIIRRLR